MTFGWEMPEVILTLKSTRLYPHLIHSFGISGRNNSLHLAFMGNKIEFELNLILHINICCLITQKIFTSIMVLVLKQYLSLSKQL